VVVLPNIIVSTEATMAVTINDVLAMIPEYDAAADYSWALTDATALMAAPFAAASPAVTSTIQDLVVKYLAAHFVVLSVERGGLASIKLGESYESYAVKQGVGLGTSRYGQMAKSLDPTRFLAGLDQVQKGTAQLSVVARPDGYDT
jgi:hypothetical protein